jgi:hypothetical protein
MRNVVCKTVFMGCLIFSLGACAEAQSPASTALSQVSLGGQVLKLVDAGGKCAVLKPDSSQVLMNLAWPCQFSQDRNGLPRIEKFKSVPVALVVHNQADSASSTDCLQTAQALRLRQGTLETSSVNQGAMCTADHDQKMFTAMFRW